MEKLAVIFTQGCHTLAVFTYKGKDLQSDLGSLFEEILNKKILPNQLTNLATSLVDEEYTSDYSSYHYIDNGYYFYMPDVHTIMMSNEKINEYIENGIEVIRMDEEKYKLINYFDVYGNQEEGYEVNNLCHECDLFIHEDACENEVLSGLHSVEFLKKSVTIRDLEIDNWDTDMIEVRNAETGEPLCRLEKYMN